MANTKQKSSGLNIEDLKKSLKTLTSEMNPEQLKRANETLEKLESSSKQDTVKNEEIQKTNLDIKKSLGKDGDVNKSLQDLLKYYKSSNDKLIKKLDEGNKVKAEQDKPKSRKNLSDIKYDQPITAKEFLKEQVAGAKGLFSKAQGVGSGVLNAFKNPMGALNNIGSGIKSKVSGVLKTGKDILSTQEGYTAEGGRAGEAYARTDVGQKEILALKKEKGISLDEARDQIRKKGEGGYADLSKKEKVISGLEEKQKFLTSQGFDPNSRDAKKISGLTDEKNKSDFRNATGPTAGPSSLATLAGKEKDLLDQKSNYAPIRSNVPGFLKPLGNIGDENEAGRNLNNAALSPTVKANDAAEASAKEGEKQFLAANPEGDNIKSAQEIMADASKEDLQISKQLLTATQESLQELKGIKEALSGSTQSQKPEPKKESGAPAAAAGADVAAESGPGIGDAIDLADDLRGKGKGGLGKAGGKLGKAGKLGGKILGGLGKAAKFLGPVGALAGAAYSGFEGYQNTSENFDLKEGEEASIGQKASSTLGGVASGMTFGLLDEKSASQGIHKAGSAIGDFFTGGKEGGEGALNTMGKMIPGVGLAKSAYDLFKGDNQKVVVGEDVKNTTGETQMTRDGSEVESSSKIDSTASVTNLAPRILGGGEETGAFLTGKGKTSSEFAAEQSESEQKDEDYMGYKIGSGKEKNSRIIGTRESGGLFGKDKYSAVRETEDATFSSIKGSSEVSGPGYYSKTEIDEQSRNSTPGSESIDLSKAEYKDLKNVTDTGSAKDVDKRLAEIQLSRSEKNVSTGASGFSMSQKDINNAKSVGQPSFAEKVTSSIGRAIPGVGLAMSAYDMFKGDKKEVGTGASGFPLQDKGDKKEVGTGASGFPLQDIGPSKPRSSSGELSKSSLEYTDLDRERAQPKPSPAPVIMNNSSNNATTKVMPMKGDPRPNSRGSAFEKYDERISTF